MLAKYVLVFRCSLPPQVCKECNREILTPAEQEKLVDWHDDVMVEHLLLSGSNSEQRT